MEYDLSLAPEGMSVSRNGVLAWRPSETQVGPFQVILRVRDDRGGVALQAFTLEVDQGNREPLILSSPPESSPQVDKLFQYQVEVEDLDGDELSYELVPDPVLPTTPNNAVLDPETGLLQWTPTAGQLGGSILWVDGVVEPWRLQIRVRDGRGGEAVQELALVVEPAQENREPEILSLPRTQTRTGDPYLYQVRAVDPDGDLLSYEVTGPAGLSVTGEGVIQWLPRVVGSFPIQVTVRDLQGASAQQSYTLEVSGQVSNRAPVITSAPVTLTNLEREYRYDVSGFDPDGDLLIWDLDEAPEGMVIDPQSGAIRWQPQADQLGENPIQVRLVDPLGSFVIQSYVLQVTGTNLPPQIVSVPLTQGAVEQGYQYPVVAVDPEGDRIRYQLGVSPEGMSIDEAGVISWIPTQTGRNRVEVVALDPEGAIGTQRYFLEVGDVALNQAPQITSLPVTLASAGEIYTYPVEANDPDEDNLTYQLLEGPSGMDVDPDTGVIRWESPIAGNYPVVAALDPFGVGATQGYTVTVRVNQPPQILSTDPPTQALVGDLYRYDLRAQDPNGDALSYELVTGPEGMSLDELGRVEWIPDAAGGPFPVELGVRDAQGAEVSQRFEITVVGDQIPPQVEIRFSQAPLDIGDAVTVFVIASDDVGLGSLSLTVDGEPVPLNLNGFGTVIPERLGLLPVVATATDRAGNQTVTQRDLEVLDPSDVTAPVIALSGFGDDFVTAPTDIIGTVIDDNLLDYTLSVAPIDTEVFTPIFTGTEPVEDGVLGQFDPTLLDNGSYLVRLQAQDDGGNIVRTETRVDVSGDLKLGNFQLSFTDLEIPVSGIPITVIRTYDSLRANQQDELGFGWRLEFRDTDLRNSLGKDELLEELGVRSNAFDLRTRIYITPPGGRREAFTFDPEPRFNLGRLPGEDRDTQLYLPRFRGDRGVTSTLTAAEVYLVQGEDDRFYGFNSGEYDPANVDYGFGGYYELTTKEGIVYRIDAQTGDLITVTDTNGNMLTYSDDGVRSSTGKSVELGRDQQGRIISLTDPMGFVVEYDYDDIGDLVRVTDQEKNQTEFIYDEPERPHYLTEIIDPLDRSLSRTEYDEQGRLVKLLNASDEQVELVYDPDNSLQTIKDGLGNPTTYEYDTRGNIVRQVDALNHQTFAEYDDENNLTRLEDPNGLISQFTYDGNSNLLSKSAPADSRVAQADLDITYYSYDRRNNLTELTLPTGASLGLRYDNQNNLVEMQDGLGSLIQVFIYNLRGDVTLEGDTFRASTYEVDDFGNVIESTDVLGIVSTMTYDANNRLKTMTEEGVTSTFIYDDLGRELRADYGNGIFVDYGYEGDQGDWTSLDAPTIGHIERGFTEDGKLGGWTLVNGTTLDFGYDEAGRWSQQIDPSGRSTENEYDPAGRLIETRDLASGNITQRDYDDGGRLITETDGLNQTTSYTYDGKGRVETITNARDKVTRYSYTNTSVTITDPLGRQTITVNSDYYVPERSQYPDGTEEISRYLFSSNLQEADEYPTKLIDRGGRDRDYSYDSVGRLSTATDLGSSLYRYDYVNEGLSQITSPLGETRKYAYEDELENLTRITYGDGTEQQMAYGVDNRLKTVTLPSGDTIEYQYNSAGQEISRTATKGGTVTTTYTLDGNVDTMTDPTGVIQYHYDPAGWLSGIDYPSGQRIRYTHDVLGQVKTVSTQTRATTPMSTTEYDYDQMGNLKTVKDPLGGLTTMSYDDGNRLEERLLPNGVRSIYTYDDLDQVRSIVHENSVGEVLVSVAYERNPGGEPNKITREDGSYVELEYDNALRLERETYYDSTGAVEEETVYGHDADGKRITKQKGSETLTYRYDPGYQLVEVTGGSEPESYSFDEDGRVEEIVREGSTLTLDHDTYDRLIQANGTSYEYDGMNRRVRSTGAVERNFLIASAMGTGLESIHQVVDGSGESVADYVYAGMMPLLSHRSDDITYYLVDGIGSVIGLVNESGQKTNDFQYLGFGRFESSPEKGISVKTGGDFRFHGQWLEKTTSLYHLRARDYDGFTGRFLSRDSLITLPANQELTENLEPYQFALNNPYFYTDPSGMFSILSINISQKIQSIINKAQVQAKIEAKEYLKEKVQGFIGELVNEVFWKLIPGDDIFSTVFPIPGPTIQGQELEKIINVNVCDLILGNYPSVLDKLWLQVAISINGVPNGNGFNCRVFANFNPKTGSFGKDPATRTSNKGLDFLFKAGLPKNTAKNPKGYLIGDITRTVSRAKRKARGTQGDAMLNYATYPKGYQFLPIALYVTLYGNDPAAEENAEKYALLNFQVVLSIVSIL